MTMAGGGSPWTDNLWVCPQKLEQTQDEGSFWLPPVVQVTEKTMFPFCVVRRQELETVVMHIKSRRTMELTDTEGLV